MRKKITLRKGSKNQEHSEKELRPQRREKTWMLLGKQVKTKMNSKNVQDIERQSENARQP